MMLVLRSLFFLFCSLIVKPSSAEQWLYLGEGFQSTTGYLGIKYSQYDFDDSLRGAQSTSSFTGKLSQLNSWQGFIIRPWIATATFTTQLGGDFNQYDLNKGENLTSLRGGQTSKVTLYPNSAYPTTFNLDQRVTKTLGTTDNLLLATNFTVNNNYRPQGETYSTSTQYLFSVNDLSEDERRYRVNRLNFTFLDYLEQSHYSLASRLNSAERTLKALETSDEDMSLRYNHYWSFDKSSSTLFSFDVSHENETDKNASGISESQRLRTQATVTSFIQSKSDDRLSYTLNGFANRSKSKFNSNAIKRDDINLSVGGFFDYNDYLEFSGSVDGTFNKNGQSETKVFSSYLSAIYQDDFAFSDTLSLSWFVSDSEVISRGDDTVALNNFRFGDGLVKNFNLADSSISVAFDQQMQHQTSTDEKLEVNEWQLTQDLAFNWSSTNSSAINTYAYLLFSDMRHLQGENMAFQHVYFNLQRNQALGRSDNWGGDLVYEWNKSTTNEGIKNSNTNAYGKLWYRNSDLWGRPNARFTSTLSMPFNNLLGEDKLKRTELASWTNDLDYRIGLLEVSLHSIMTKKSYYVSLEFKRTLDF